MRRFTFFGEGSGLGERLLNKCFYWRDNVQRSFRREKNSVTEVMGIDDWYYDGWGSYVSRVMEERKPDLVMVGYVYLSKVLEQVRMKCPTWIDTHDKFSGRGDLFLQQGVKPNFFFTNEQEEAKGLNRADGVIAISDEEREFFSSLVSKPCRTIPHLVVERTSEIPDQPAIGFIGSDNPINRLGMDWFLRECWPLVHEKKSSLVLYIAGTICRYLEEGDVPDRVVLRGRMDLDEFYDSIRCAIVPLHSGTGQKIKFIEALGQKTPVVTTTHGAGDDAERAGCGLMVADSAGEFADALITLATDDMLLGRFRDDAARHIRLYNEQTTKALADLLKDSVS
jgi:glycosyltransferase involved in cell wall biosynthesis